MQKYPGNKITTVRLDNIETRKLNDYCKATGQKKSKVLRNAIDKYIKAGSILYPVLHPLNSPANLDGEGI
jgi:hypothetical protein